MTGHPPLATGMLRKSLPDPVKEEPMSWDHLMGFIAGALTSVGMLAQILQIVATGSSRDVNWLFFILMLLGVLLWLYYGLKRRDLVLIFWNIVGVLLCTAVLVLKFWYG